MHYDVDRKKLKELSLEIKELAAIQREACNPEEENCVQKKKEKCRSHSTDMECSEEVRFACHGSMTEEEERDHHEHCKCKKS